ncbi:MAG TPA: FtsX-like permease family protein [Stellaceae bacterium]|jgi:putative ABC transport system permease protein
MIAPDTARLSPRFRAVPLAWRNLVANKRRLLRSSAGIAFATLLMMVQLGFEQGFFDASLSLVRAIDGDLVVTSAYKYRFGTRDPFAHGFLDPVRSVPGVASAAPLYADWQDFFWTSPSDGKPYLVRVLAFDPAGPTVLSIPGLTALQSRLDSDDAVLVDDRARDFLGMDTNAGSSQINGQGVRIAGRFSLGPDFMSDGTAIMGDRLFAKLLPGNRDSAANLPIEAIVVKVAAGSTVPAVQNALKAKLPDTIDVMTKAGIVEFERKFQAELSSAGPIFWLGAIVGFVVGMLISYQVIYNDLSDQLAQYATLKAMGYKTSYLVRSVLAQAALSGLAGYVPAWLLCLVVYRVIGVFALLPLHMNLRLTALTLGLTMGMCLIAAMLAVRRVVSADPAEIF